MVPTIICAGQALIDCIFSGGDVNKGVVESIDLCPGGEAFNEAMTASAIGARAYLLCALGDDPAGGLIRSVAKEGGVDASFIVEGRGERTPVSGLFVDDRGERCSAVSHAHELKYFSPSLDGLPGADAVMMASLFRPPFLDPAVCARFARQARAKGAIVLADTKMPRGTSPRLKDYAAVLGELDYITPNETEAAYYTGTDDPEKSAAVFRSFGVRCVIIKLGARGCYVLPQDGAAFTVPAISVPVVDGIGAGDAFAAGLVTALCEGQSLREACRFSTACAALCVMHRGAVGGITSRSQVLELMGACAGAAIGI